LLLLCVCIIKIDLDFRTFYVVNVSFILTLILMKFIHGLIKCAQTQKSSHFSYIVKKINIIIFAESPLPLIDSQSGGDGNLTQHSILYPKPIHPNSGSEIEIELCEEDHTTKDDSSSSDSMDVMQCLIHVFTFWVLKGRILSITNLKVMKVFESECRMCNSFCSWNRKSVSMISRTLNMTTSMGQ
jgi:hypothetical protein